MLRSGKHSFGIVLILLIALALVATACGSEGTQGLKGIPGDKGAVGGKGATGDKGATGNKGATGDKGPTGVKAPTGRAGKTYPTKLIVVPTGVTASDQPAVVRAGARQPLVTVYGTGFPANEGLLIEVISPDGTAIAMEYVGQDAAKTSVTGAFKVNIRTDIAGLTLTSTTYTLKATTLSGVAASAPVVIR